MTIKLPIYDIEITLGPPDPETPSAFLGGSITSDLKEPLNSRSDEEGTDLFNAAMDGIESLITAHACAGVDIAAPAYLEGIETAVEAAANNI